MVQRKQIFIACLLLIPLLLFSQEQPEPIVETQETSILGTPTDIDEAPADTTYTEPEAQTPAKKELTFTIDDIIAFIETDKEMVIHHNSISEVNYHNIVRINSFRLFRPLLPANAYIAKLNNLGTLNPNINQYTTIKGTHNGMPVVFDTDTYPYEVSLTRFYAGMGELDKDFADITFRKDAAFSIENLQLRGDFKAINDYTNKNVSYPNQDYNKTSDAFFQMDYTLYEIDISAMYLNTNTDLTTPDYYIYDHNPKNMLHDSLDLKAIQIGWKYLYAGYMQAENYLSTSPNTTYATEAYIAGVKYEINSHAIDLTYQKNFDKIKGIQPTTQKYNDDIYSLKYSLDHPFDDEDIEKPQYALASEVSLYNQKINGYAQLSANVHKNLFLIGEANYSDYLRPQVPYFRFENYLTQSYKGGVGYYHLKDRDQFWLDANIMAGQKGVTQFTDQADKVSEKFITISNDVNANLLIDKYLFNINHTLVYDDYKQPFYLLPLFTNTTDCSITLLMQNNNKIALGTKISLISEVKNAQENIFPANHCIDAYLSIGITKVFDIKVVFNNISRRQYYGNDLLDDFHFTSMLTWYFIN